MMTNSPVISTLEPSRYHDSFGGVDDLLEQLDNALAREEGELRLYRLIDALSACAQRELLDEEEAMKWASYPSLEFHRAKHRFFVGEIGKLKSLSLSKQMQFVRRVVRFLRDWLSYHRRIDDGTFSDFMASGLQPAVSLCGS